MEKKIIYKIVFSMTFVMCCLFSVMAHGSTGLTCDNGEALAVKCVGEATDGVSNFKYFEVEAKESGEYYVEFWLIPARYSSNEYTKFAVCVNNEYVGNIVPEYGNWQSAKINGRESIDLQKGVNVITVATKAPEFPEVEGIKVAATEHDAHFSSQEYQDYLSKAEQCEEYDIPTEENHISALSNTTDDSDEITFRNIPLIYTFYKIVTFTKGQDVFITSSSKTKHNLDIVYYGSLATPEMHVDSQNKMNAESQMSGITLPTDPSPKYTVAYIHATSEEMQGLNWRQLSQQALNSDVYVSTIRMTVPKDGAYLIRLRTNESGKTSIADLNVNGLYYYEDVPISFSFVNCNIPTNKEYVTMTCCDNFGIDDPFLFIHGAASDRIVGFNDDGPSLKLRKYNLSSRDSYIEQKYFVMATGISVSNYSSSNPVSKCSISSFSKDNDSNNIGQNFRMNRHSQISQISESSVNNIKIDVSTFVGLGEDISISSNEIINTISVYNISGEELIKLRVDDNEFSMPVSAMNIAQSGIYIINFSTVEGCKSEKIIVK